VFEDFKNPSIDWGGVSKKNIAERPDNHQRDTLQFLTVLPACKYKSGDQRPLKKTGRYRKA
jgi:hypothetical protein